MATDRKRWVRIADAVAREPWTNDELATMVRLAGYLNTRWARDGLTAEDGCKVVLSQGQLMDLTGSGSLVRARRIVDALAARVSLIVDRQGAYTSIEWRKFAEFQRWASESRENFPPKLPSPNPTSYLLPPDSSGVGEEHSLRKTSGSEPAAPSRALADRADRLANALAHEPGGNEEKRAFVRENLALIEAEVDRENPPTKRARSGAFRSIVIRYWRRHHNGPPARAAPETFTERRLANTKRAMQGAMELLDDL